MRLSKFAEAILTWRKQPACMRESLFHFFIAEAVRSDDLARHEQAMGRGRKKEYRRHREAAATLRAAMGVLEAVSSTKRARRRG